MTDDRKLDILSRLAAGKLSAEEADAQLHALERSSSAPNIDEIRSILYDLLDLEDTEDDEEKEEIQEIVDYLQPSNLMDTLRELLEAYDLDPDAFCCDIIPLLGDSDEAFSELCSLLADSSDLLDANAVLDSVFDSFTLTPERLNQLSEPAILNEIDCEQLLSLLAAQPKIPEEMLVSVIEQINNSDLLQDFLRKKPDCATPAVLSAALSNGTLSPETLISTFGSRQTPNNTPEDPWENVWKDCLSKRPNQAFPAYDCISVTLPAIQYSERSRTISADCSEDICAKEVTVNKEAALAGSISAYRLQFKQKASVQGEIKATKIESSTSLKLEDRACFDRLHAAGEFTAQDRLVGNSLVCSGNISLNDTQCRVIHLNGNISAAGVTYACALTASGNIAVGDTLRSQSIELSGNFSIGADIHTASLTAKGNGTFDREIWSSDAISANGNITFNAAVSSKRFTTSGNLCLQNTLRCTWGTVSLSGRCTSEGEIIEMQGFSCHGILKAQNIGCDLVWTKVVDITLENEDSHIDRICAVTTRVSALDDSVLHIKTIVGHSIDVRNTHADLLRADYVSVGSGCHIKLLQYTAAVQVDPTAIVEKTEKIVHT